MPRDLNGNYTLPAGNPVITGTPIEAVWANPTMADLGAEITNSLDRNGRGGMLAPFKFVDGLAGAPSITFTNEPSLGLFRAGSSDMQVAVAGVPRMRWTSAGSEFWDGSAWINLTSLSPASGTVTIAGAQTITGLKTFKAPSGGSFIDVEKNLATQQAGMRYRREDGSQRWQTGLVGAASDDFFLGRFNASGVFQDSPIVVASSTGVVTFSATINGNISGNAATATNATNAVNATNAATLATPRAINGTNFDGSAPITTTLWGTARTITLGASGKSVNGSGNVTWTLGEMGAAADADVVKLTGNQTIAGVKTFSSAIDLQNADTTLSRLGAGQLGIEGKAALQHNGSYTSARVTVSTSAPSGGADGDIWLRV